PTAGLHFTPELLTALADRGILMERVTLHVGYGTFQPVKSEDTQDHVMHSEWCDISESTCDRLKKVRESGGRIVAVGTTAVRTLETAAQATGDLKPYRGETRLFVTPPYDFRAVDGMITNFHFPKTTLLMLVSAFAGTQETLAAYREAVKQRYRFF